MERPKKDRWSNYRLFLSDQIKMHRLSPLQDQGICIAIDKIIEWKEGLETHKREEDQKTTTKEETQKICTCKEEQGYVATVKFEQGGIEHCINCDLPIHLPSSPQQNNNSISEDQIMEIGNIMCKYDLNDAEETYKCAEEILSKLPKQEHNCKEE